MKNNLRRLIAVLGVATLGVVSGASGAYSQSSSTESTSATAVLPVECTIELSLVDDFDGDTIDIGGATDDLEADARLDVTCNTTSVSIGESNTFEYTGSVADAGDDIFDYITVTTTNFNGDTAGTTDVGVLFNESLEADVEIEPGQLLSYNPPGDEIVIAPKADGGILPAGTYTYTKTVTVAPN